MTTALFAALRLIRTGGVVAAAMRNFSVCCFGIYLIHYFFVGPTYKLVEALFLPTAVRVPVAAVLVVACAWLVVATIKRSFRRTTWLLG